LHGFECIVAVSKPAAEKSQNRLADGGTESGAERCVDPWFGPSTDECDMPPRACLARIFSAVTARAAQA
jgi:hypothetical protein